MYDIVFISYHEVNAEENYYDLYSRFNTVGVSDGKTMGTDSMRFSLPSRELITDSIETMITAEHYDGCILIPGCDKNLPAAAMALARVNRPGFIIYGGSMRPSSKVINGSEVKQRYMRICREFLTRVFLGIQLLTLR